MRRLSQGEAISLGACRSNAFCHGHMHANVRNAWSACSAAVRVVHWTAPASFLGHATPALSSSQTSIFRHHRRRLS
jgi:hypothetical protein